MKPTRDERKDVGRRDKAQDGDKDSLSSIFVSTDNGVFICKVALCSTVAFAKGSILRACAGDRGHCDPSDVWLKSRSNGLQDDWTLEQCGVHAEETISLMVRVRGDGAVMECCYGEDCRAADHRLTRKTADRVLGANTAARTGVGDDGPMHAASETVSGDEAVIRITGGVDGHGHDTSRTTCEAVVTSKAGGGVEGLTHTTSESLPR